MRIYDVECYVVIIFSYILLASDFKTGVKISRVTFRLNIEQRYKWYREGIQMNVLK